MKKKMMPIILALIIGIILGKIMIEQYDSNVKLIPTFSTNKKVYFVQYGVYSSEEAMEKEVAKLDEYIYNIEDNKYYVYIGMSTNLKNAEKIKGFYEKKEYITYIKEITMSNKNFITILEQYDILLEEADENIIDTICKQVLNKYKELVLNDS